MLSKNDIRPAAVAGSFYPDDPGVLGPMVDGFLANGTAFSGAPKALVAPHAGYVYSGASAGRVFSQLTAVKDRIRRVVLIGPSHRVALNRVAAPSHSAFATPFGDVPVDRTAIAALLKLPFCELNDAAHEQEHSLEVMLPFLQRTLGEFSIVPLVAGQVSASQVREVLRLLWGGPETLIVASSDLSHFLSYDEAVRLDNQTARDLEGFRWRKIGRDQACGRIPLHGLLDHAAGLDLRISRIDLCNSGDTAGDHSRVVGYGAWAMEYAAGARLPDGQRELLQHIARRALVEGAESGAAPRIDLDTVPVPLRSERATFVTLHVDGRFRGCRGTMAPVRALAHDVAENAFSSAFNDPRVSSLTAQEVRRAEIGISILSCPRRIACSSEDELIDRLAPERDGLILAGDDKRSLFLPKVWHDVPHPRDFIQRLKVKGGWEAGEWPSGMKAFRFSAEYF